MALVVLCMALLGMWGCRPEAISVDSVSIRPTSVELTVGSTYQLSAAVSPSDAPQEVEWTSSRSAVATVNASGLVTAVALGECDITVFAGDKSDVCHVTVVDGDPTHPSDPNDPQNPSVGGFDQNGASNAVFTVAEGRTVKFSKGNLQYQASTGTWRFAEHQYDCIGADNQNISSTYNGWIDLFGWGTSGWNSGANAYQPWATSTSYSDYYPGGSYNNSLTGSYANADWGVYNRISNGGNQAGMWRTLTKDEWNYLLFTRNGSTVSGTGNARFAEATVGSVTGLIVFPDSFTLPTGITMVGVNSNSTESGFSDNTYTTSEWSQLESNGALFLPAAGIRYGTEVYDVGTIGYYWSSTDGTENYARGANFDGDDIDVGGDNRFGGISVRLVQD